MKDASKGDKKWGLCLEGDWVKQSDGDLGGGSDDAVTKIGGITVCFNENSPEDRENINFYEKKEDRCNINIFPLSITKILATQFLLFTY